MTAPADYLKLHFLVFLWGFTAVLGLLISLPAVEMVLYRTLLAWAGMGVLLYFRKIPVLVKSRTGIALLLTGLLVAAHWITFFASARVSNASVSLVGFATGSLWVAFIEPLFNQRKILWFEVFLGVMVIAGLYVIFSFDFKYPLGLALGIASGLLMALFSVINARLVQRVRPNVITFYEMGSACIAILVFLPLYKNYWAQANELRLLPKGADWLWLAILSWVCTVYAYSAGVELMRRLSVFTIQLTLNLEPIYGILLALVIFGDSEKMEPRFYIGTVIIIISVFSYPLLRKYLAARYRVPDQQVQP